MSFFLVGYAGFEPATLGLKRSRPKKARLVFVNGLTPHLVNFIIFYQELVCVLD
jgi:hypothetical protein